MKPARLASPEEIPHCLHIRRVVFIEGQSVPESLEVDGLDPECDHFLVEHDGELVGTARLRITAEGYAKLERVAVLEALRGKGLGVALVRAAERRAFERGHRELFLSSQTYAIPFYERLGYRAFGPEFDDAGIPHRKMSCTLAEVPR